jgi:flagellar assembly protein FliH
LILFPDLDEPGPDPVSGPMEVLGFEMDTPPVRSMPATPVRNPSLFTEDFDAPTVGPREPEIVVPTFSLAEFEAAREEAWNDGKAAALTAAEAEHWAAVRGAMATMIARLDAARDELTRQAEASAEALTQLLIGLLGTLFPSLCARFGPGEVSDVLKTVLPILRLEPRAVIRVPPSLVPAIRDVIADSGSDLSDRIEIVADETLVPGDIRVAWQRGHAVRDVRALWAEIGDALGQAGWPVPSSEWNAVSASATTASAEAAPPGPVDAGEVNPGHRAPTGAQQRRISEAGDRAGGEHDDAPDPLGTPRAVTAPWPAAPRDADRPAGVTTRTTSDQRMEVANVE